MNWVHPPTPTPPSIPRPLSRLGTALGLVLVILGLPSVGTSADTPEPHAEAGDLFTSTNLLRIEIELDENALAALRERSGAGERPRAQATVIEGLRRYFNVGVQLKGFSSFRPIDDRPSLTLKFDRFVPGQTFHGLDKLSLNNSLQDATRLNEVLARDVFAAAGVPVPRATHAVVGLNGRSLGVYVLTEGYDKAFLRRYFPRADGTLFEGGTLHDIDADARVTTGPEEPGTAALQRLIAAAHESDAHRRYEALLRCLDVERFLSMIAVETLLCHSDSYTMNRNNYRFYHDPASDRFVFMPHGMDRILGGHRSDLDLTIVPPQAGLIARALLTTDAGRRQFLERLGQINTNLFQPARLCEHVRAWDDRILDEKASGAFRARARRLQAHDHRRDTTELCRCLTVRAGDVSAQLRGLSEYLRQPRFPQFDTNGFSYLHDWIHRPTPPYADGRCTVEQTTNATRLHLQSTNGPIQMMILNRLTLPAGRYRLDGDIQLDAPTNAVTTLAATLHRWSGSRFDLDSTPLSWAAPRSWIGVSRPYAPEEVELVCEVRSSATNLWLDITRLRITRPPATEP